MLALASTLWRIIRRDRLALFGACVLLAMLIIALAAPLIAPYDPLLVNYRVEGVVFRFDGSRWTPPSVVSPWTLAAVTFLQDGGALAVGPEGVAMRLADGRWSTLSAPAEFDFRAVAAAGDLVVAVGDRGAIAHLADGAWQVRETSFTGDLRSVALASPESGIAVGAAGTIVRWDGQEWSLLPSGIRDDLASVALLAGDEALIVGARGAVFRLSDEQLRRELAPAFRDLFGVAAGPDGDAIAVGARGTIMQHDGTRWRQVTAPESRDLVAVAYTGAGRAIAVGGHGVVLELADGRWRRVEVGYRRNLLALATSPGGEAIAVGTDPFVNQLEPPSTAHLFGTTHLGRDIFSQTVWGSRTALLVGILAALMVTVIGTNVGLIAGYFKGRTGNLLMRLVDVMYALPFEPFALVLVLIFQPSLTIVILAIGLLTWRTTARIIRSQVLSLSERPFVKAARVAGASDFRILYVHIAPNVLPLAFLQLAVAMAFAITAEATLSFLGLGPPQVHSWGTILHEARLSGAWRTAWWWIIPPGLLIMVTVVSVFFIARALEVLTNPRLETREWDAARRT